MTDTGYNWGDWAFVEDEDGNDWNARALADDATEISAAANSLDGIAACEVGLALAEDDTGAIDGVATVYVLGGGIDDEEPGVGSPFAFTLAPVRNDTVYKRFAVDPAMYGDFKLAVKNEAGQELAVSVKVRTATIPLATA